MLTKLIFVLYLITGIDYAYKAEVYNWIETGSFQYNEDFED